MIDNVDENFKTLLKTMSNEVLREAKFQQLDSTQFNLDTHIDEVLKLVKPSIVDQEFVDFYVNIILHSFSKKERKIITLRESPLKIWKKIEPHLLVYLYN